MKKVLLSFALVVLTATLSVILTGWIFANFYFAISTSILAGSLVSIALAVTLYANIFDREVTLRPSIHFHPFTPIDDMKLDPSVEQGLKDFAEAVANPKYPTDAPYEDRYHQVKSEGMIKK